MESLHPHSLRRWSLRVLTLASLAWPTVARTSPSLAEPPPPPRIATTQPATTTDRAAASPLFDPDRHMRVSEVRRGMTGYGLTVFHGTTIERFEVEVIDVLRSFSPGADAILIMAKGERLQHSGSIAGMSGSPIYLRGDDGRHRLVGALAFGWRLAKDPIAGVQPIEHMLDVADPLKPRPPAFAPRQAATTDAPSPRAGGGGPQPAAPTWRYADHFPSPALPASQRVRSYLARHLTRLPGAPSALVHATAPGGNIGWSLAGLSATPPWSTSLEPLLQLAGAGELRWSAVARPPADVEPRIEPGSSLVIPLLTGDFELAAFGTCTEVLGERVFGFGHPFNGEGGVELPMAAGYVSGIISNLESSFKIGAMTRRLGVVRADTVAGVGGTFGGTVPLTDITVHVRYDDGSLDRTLRFTAARHPNFVPLLAMITTLSGLQLLHAPPADHSLVYRVEARYDEGQTLVLTNRLAGSDVMELISGIALPLHALADSPFGRRFPDSIRTTLEVIPGRFQAELAGLRVLPPRARPGASVRVVLTLNRPDGGTERHSFPWTLPSDIEPGTYDLKVSNHSVFLADELQQRPGRFFARSMREQFEVLTRVSGPQADHVYVRLIRGPDGLAVGPAGFERLPESLSPVLTAAAGQAGLPAQPVVRSHSTTFPLGLVLTGEQTVKLVIEAEPGRRPRPTRPEAR